MTIQSESRRTGAVIHTVMIIFCILCLIPMLLTLSISFTDNRAVVANGYQLWPAKFSLSAYIFIFQDPGSILTGYKKSVTVTLCGTLLDLLVTTLVSYSLSRRSFHFRGLISGYIFFTMVFSGGMVPTYILIVRYLGWKDSLLALIIPAIAVPWNIFLMRVLFQDVPDSLVEAAKIDGSSDLSTFFRIVLPLAKPAVATLTLIVALGYWNEAFNAILYIDSQQNYTIQLVLQHVSDFVYLIKTGAMRSITGGHMIDPASIPSDGVMYGLMVIGTLPMVFLFTALQKYFIKGITAGAVKG